MSWFEAEEDAFVERNLLVEYSIELKGEMKEGVRDVVGLLVEYNERLVDIIMEVDLNGVVLATDEKLIDEMVGVDIRGAVVILAELKDKLKDEMTALVRGAVSILVEFKDEMKGEKIEILMSGIVVT